MPAMDIVIGRVATGYLVAAVAVFFIGAGVDMTHDAVSCNIPVGSDGKMLSAAAATAAGSRARNVTVHLRMSAPYVRIRSKLPGNAEQTDTFRSDNIESITCASVPDASAFGLCGSGDPIKTKLYPDTTKKCRRASKDVFGLFWAIVAFLAADVAFTAGALAFGGALGPVYTTVISLSLDFALYMCILLYGVFIRDLYADGCLFGDFTERSEAGQQAHCSHPNSYRGELWLVFGAVALVFTVVRGGYWGAKMATAGGPMMDMSNML